MTLPAMRFGKAADVRRAEARAFLRPICSCARLTEAFEHVSLFVIGDADPVDRWTPNTEDTGPYPRDASFANNSTVPPGVAEFDRVGPED